MVLQRSLLLASSGFAFLMLLLMASCSGGKSDGPARLPRVGSELHLEVLEGSFLGEPQPGSFQLDIREEMQELIALVSVADARRLKALYFAMDYNPAELTPLAVAPTERFRSAAREAGLPPELLMLEVLDRPGVVHCGMILPRPQLREGFSGDGVLAEVRFARRPFDRTASAPPVTDASAVQPNWIVESRTLSWRYSCQGDYNQDGYVTVNDLTPLGVHFELAGPFDYLSALSVVDGNDDGFITISDITSIGQNFGRSVEGYHVFASEDIGLLPEGNDTQPMLEPYDAVPFEEGEGDPLVDRLHYAREYPELPPDAFVWVRPVSDDLHGTPSMPQYPKACMWQKFNVSSVSPAYAGTSNSVAMVNGLPAVCYREFVTKRLVFQRATSPIGATWGLPVGLDSSDDPGYFTSMALVDGKPAVSYYAADTHDLLYAVAQDGNGVFWYSPLLIDHSGDVGRWSQLLVVNGNPAICYQDFTNGGVKFVRALSATGSTWDTPVTAAASGDMVEYCSMVIANGNPAICYYNASQQDMEYVRANDTSGSSWGAAAAVDQSIADEGVGCSMFIVNGRPAIAYWNNGALFYIRASDANGGSWGIPVWLDPTNPGILTRGVSISLHVNNGKPAVSYYSGTPNHDLMYLRALDADGTAWSAPYAVDSPDNVGVDCHLTNVGTSPAISYFDDTANHLKFAICVNAFNQAPTATLVVPQPSVKLGQPHLLDASGSFDPDGEVVMYEWDFNDDESIDLNTGIDPHAEYIYPEPGVYVPRVWVTDNSGASVVASAEVEVRENIRPHAELVATPDFGNPPFVVNFDASGSSDEDGTIVSYEWDWDGDGIFDASTDNDPHWSWEYEVSGEFLAAVKVTDDSGGSDTGTVLCSSNSGPIAVVAPDPVSGPAPLDVAFDGSGSYDSDGSIVEHWWDVRDDGVYEAHDGGPPDHFEARLIWNGGVKVRLRVKDNGGMFGSAVATINVSGGWHVSQVDESGNVGSALSLAIINGRPAISYFDATNLTLKYVRGADANGYNWPASMTLGAISKYPNSCWGTSLAYFNGSFPGIVYNATPVNPADWQRCLVRSTNSDGTAWNPIQEVPGGSGSDPSLILVASNPAFAAVDSDLIYTRATNATGTAWGVQKIVDTDSGAYGCSMKVVEGQPSIAYTYRGGGAYDKLCYIRSVDDTGDNWGTRIVLEDAQYGIEAVSMAIIDGRPAVAYTVSTSLGGDWEARYRRASDVYGNAWPPGHKLLATGCRYDISLAEINGRPAVAARTCADHDLLYLRAADSTGSADWPEPIVVDNTDNNTGGGSAPDCDMLSIGGKPAIAYCHSVSGNLMYVIWE